MIEDKLKDITISTSLFSIFFKNLKRNILSYPITEDKKQIIKDKLDEVYSMLEDFNTDIKRLTQLIERESYSWEFPSTYNDSEVMHNIRDSLDFDSSSFRKSANTLNNDIQLIDKMLENFNSVAYIFSTIPYEISGTRFVKYDKALEKLYKSLGKIHKELSTLSLWYLRLKQII